MILTNLPLIRVITLITLNSKGEFMSDLKNARIITPVGRVAFVKNLFKPNDKGRYSVAVVFDTDADTVKALEPLKGLIGGLVKEKWGDKAPSNLFTPMKIETREDMLEKYDFMRDKVTLNASNGFEVSAIDTNNQELFDGDIKAGDYVRLSISGYTYDNQNKGVGFNVNAVQFIKKGEAFYSRQNASEMFAEAPKVADAEGFTGNENTGGGEEASFNNYGF